MLDALISGGANILGNMMTASSQKQANQNNMAIAMSNLEMQKELAHHGITWKVNDAKEAGLHPLAALGANTMSFSPVTAGQEGTKFDFSELGQSLERAAKANSNEAQRQAVDEKKLRELEIEKRGLENDALKADLVSTVRRSSTRGGQLGPAMPTPFGAGAIPVAHLSRSPARAYGGTATKDKDVEIAQEAERPFVKGYIGGVPYAPSPSSTIRGEAAENLFGDDSVAAAIADKVALADDWQHNWINLWGPYVDRQMFTGSGYRAKRFRRGRYTAPSYRPWSE